MKIFQLKQHNKRNLTGFKNRLGLSLIYSDYSSNVLKSPSSSPSALAFRTRLIIFPERVLGSLSTKVTL